MDLGQRVALGIIRAVLPRSEREWILGDIHEELDRLTLVQGRTAARRWLRGEAIRVLIGAFRLRAALGRQPTLAKGDHPMRTLLQDVRYALRLLARSPGFAAIAVVTLGTGIGASASIFSVVHGVLMEPLPYAEPERLVRLFDANERQPKFPMAPANFLEYRSQVPALEAVAAYERADLQIGGDRPEQLRGMRVTSGFFTLLGWQPALGRDFRRDEERSGNGNAVILSHTLWQRRFSADPSIVGRTIVLSDRQYVVVGVLPAGFRHVGGTYRTYAHGDSVDVWSVRSMPEVPQPRDRNQHYLNVVARVRAGVSVDQAARELAAASSRLATQYPASNAAWSVRLSPLREEIVGSTEPMLLVLLGAVQLVLLLACVNVAGLLLGRATTRNREIGVRAALGATRIRLVRQLVVESLVLAGGGGVLGVAIAAGVVRALPALGPEGTPRLDMVTVDWAVVAYTMAASLLTAVIFGLAPALQLARSNVNDTLKHGGRALSGASGYRLRGMLVATEIALAFVLVVGAGLLLRSFARLSAVDPGFRPDGALTARLSLPQARYRDTAAGAAFYARVHEQAARIPGVRHVGAGSDLPWTGYDENTSFGILGRTFAKDEGPEARFHMVTPGYFAALEVPLIAGRNISESDTAEAPLVVVINERLARQYWGGTNPAAAAVGARLDLWGNERTVAGVVGDVRDTPWSAAAEPALYFPQAQQSYGQDMLLVVRGDVPPSSLIEPLTRAVREIDPALPLAGVAPLDQIASRAFEWRRFLLVLVGGFGVTALFLAMVGVYGVMAQAVGQRVREFGVRQALGARPADILRIVLKSGAVIAAGGAVLGLALAVATTRLLAASLYNTHPLDPLTFAAVGGLLMFVALVAAYVPARRAMSVDPAVALRTE